MYNKSKKNKLGGNKVKKLIQRAKYVARGEEGAIDLDTIIGISISLVIATVLFVFRGKIMDFITKAGEKVDTFETE